MNPWNYVENPSRQECDETLARLRYKNPMQFIDENNEVGVLADGELNLQGLVNLADNYEEDGGFHVVPGFAHHLAEWAKATAKTLKPRYGLRQTFIVMPEDEPMQAQALRVTCPAGSLVVWNQCTPHGSAPNHSPNTRYAQFLKLFPAIDIESNRGKARAETIRHKIHVSDFEGQTTELGEKLFGLRSWK